MVMMTTENKDGDVTSSIVVTEDRVNQPVNAQALFQKRNSGARVTKLSDLNNPMIKRTDFGCAFPQKEVGESGQGNIPADPKIVSTDVVARA